MSGISCGSVGTSSGGENAASFAPVRTNRRPSGPSRSGSPSVGSVGTLRTRVAWPIDLAPEGVARLSLRGKGGPLAVAFRGGRSGIRCSGTTCTSHLG